MIDDRALERSLERAARSWLEAGPTRAPEHALVAALERIDHTNQERGLRVPWRFRQMSFPARLAAAAVLGALALGGALLVLGGGGRSNTPAITTPPSPTPPAASVAATTDFPLDYSDLEGRILMEHLGNAPDLSEMPTSDYHPERRRLYFMDPSTMTGATAEEFLPGQPPEGKLNADISPDGRQVAFMDTADPARIWIANLDGTGLHQVTTDCSGCSELDPAFDPTGTKIVFVHLEGAWRHALNGSNGYLDLKSATNASWIAIRDLASGEVTVIESTRGSGAEAIPEQPSWSHDGTRIVFHRTTWGDGELPESSRLEVVDIASGDVTPLATTPQVTWAGDPKWSLDDSTILFTNPPWSSMGSLPGLPDPASILTIPADDSGPAKRVGSGAGASWLPDGRILYQNNMFWIMDADGSNNRPINANGSDLSDLPQGFAYIPHWVPAP